VTPVSMRATSASGMSASWTAASPLGPPPVSPLNPVRPHREPATSHHPARGGRQPVAGSAGEQSGHRPNTSSVWLIWVYPCCLATSSAHSTTARPAISME